MSADSAVKAFKRLNEHPHIFKVDKVGVLQLLHDLDLHEDEVLLGLLGQVDVLDGHHLLCVVVPRQRDHAGGPGPELHVLEVRDEHD